jgi:hypothetical protein
MICQSSGIQEDQHELLMLNIVCLHIFYVILLATERDIAHWGSS